MFIAGLVFLILGLLGSVISLKAIKVAGKSRELEPSEVASYSNVARWITRGVEAFGLLLIFFSFLSQIPVGHVGVQTVFGRVQSRVLKEGLNVKNPLAHVIKMTVQTQAYTMSIAPDEGEKQGGDQIEVLSKDNLTVSMDLTVLYRLVSQDAQFVFRQLGDTEIYTEKIVRPSIRTAIRNVASKYLASELMSTARATAEVDIFTELESIFNAYFKPYEVIGVEAERVLLRNVQPPKALKDAIEAKLTKEQEMQAMQFTLEKERKEAERKTIEANGLAVAQGIINKTLTREYLQWKYIETLEKLVNSPNHTTIILPFDQKLTPMLQIPTEK